MKNNQKKYDAFISYKHEPYTYKIAHNVLRKLEHYRPPKDSEAQKKKLYLCIDDQNFASAGILSRQIYDALDNSEYLIYLACPETLDSQYCLDEVRYFKNRNEGSLDHVIVLLIKGEPADVFPQELCYEGCWEPGRVPDPDKKKEVLWLDLRADNIRGAIEKLDQSLLKIAAPLLHCELDGLIQRNRQWKKQKRMMWGMFCAAMLTITLSVTYTFWLTWLMDYKRQAQDALADGNDNKALFYYAKALSLNPFDRESCTNAQILLQQKPWPMVVETDEDSVILGNRIYPMDKQEGTDRFSVPVCITSGGDHILWGAGGGRYYHTNADGTIFEDLSDMGVYNYPEEQTLMDAWCFSKSKEKRYTFYWPEENRVEELEWNSNFSWEWSEAGICPLQPGVIAVGDFETLAFYRLEQGNCQELYHIRLNEIFNDDPLLLEKYGISLADNYVYNIYPSPDGSYLAAIANYWENWGKESVCYSEAVLFDTESFELILLEKSQKCLLSSVVFEDDNNKLALIYNNQYGVLENSGYVSVYDCSGNLKFQTECSSQIVPENVSFCGEVFVLCDYSATYFLDAQSGALLCEPLMLYINHAALTETGLIALECGLDVRYCRIVEYSDSMTEEFLDKDIFQEYQNKMEMKIEISDSLRLSASDDRAAMLLTDENGTILDYFSIQETGNENFIIELDYGTSTQTAFALDSERDLHCILVNHDLKKFASTEQEAVHGGVLAFNPAPNGVVYLDSYFPGYYYAMASNLRYTTDDRFLFYHDPEINYFGWNAEPNITGSFLGLISGESDYAAILGVKEELLNFRFFNMKNGDFLASMSYDVPDDFFGCLTPDNSIYLYFDGNWKGIWLGLHRADRRVWQQLMDLSGYTLYGSRIKNNQKLDYSESIISPESLGGWSKYLQWKYLSFH